MNHRLVVALALFANIAADIALVWSAIGVSFPSPALVAAYALVLGQAGLAAIWLGIGSAPLVLRIVGELAVLALDFLFLRAMREEGGAWLTLLSVQTASIAGPLMLARWFGLRLQSAELPTAAHPWQFTLRHLFVITTASAVLLGVIRLAQPWFTSRNVAVEACVLGVGFALTALVAVWVSLGYGRWFFKTIALPAVAALVAVLFVAIEGRGGTNVDLGIVAIVLTQTLYMTLTLLVLRRCGYRLLRKCPSNRIIAGRMLI